LICSWAQHLFQEGQYNQAFDKFFEALKYNEENDEIYYELGKCNYYIKSFQDSISHFKRAITIKPQESNYYFGLGCAYDEFGSVKNAKIAFYDAININPMNIKARIAYAISLTKELEYAQAIEQFLEVLKSIPDNADTLYNLALCYELVGDIERAIKYYKQAIDIDNEHREANHNLELLLGEKYIPEGASIPQDNIQEEIIEEEPEPVKQDSIVEVEAVEEPIETSKETVEELENQENISEETIELQESPQENSNEENTANMEVSMFAEPENANATEIDPDIKYDTDFLN